MTSLLVGCGLRRTELSALTIEDLQIRQGHLGHRGPGWQRKSCPYRSCACLGQASTRSMEPAKVTAGRIFRAVSRHGTPWGKGISENVICTSSEVALSGCGPSRSTRSPANLRKALSFEWRGIGTNSVPPWSCFRAHDGTISGLQAESGGPCK